MSSKVILDALLPRADFLVEGDSSNYGKNITELSAQNIGKNGGFLLEFLRKPDFQRETNEWDSTQIISLVESFLDGELIPSIILWKNSANFIFVIDGAHRLSALLSWLYDDYGDGEISLKYFGGDISEEQKKIAADTRKRIESKIGSYDDFMQKSSHPNATGEQKSRKLNLLTSALAVQWINGNAEKAEVSFEKINQQSSPLSQIERVLIKERKNTYGIVSRAIYWGGTGHKYWRDFESSIQADIENKSNKINEMLFKPTLKSRLDSLNLPIGGTNLGSKDQQLILSLVKIIYQDDDNLSKQQNVVNCLNKTLKVIRQINSEHASSLGFHSVVYVYDESGLFRHGYLLGLIDFFIKIKDLNHFTKVRGKFETFLFERKNYLQQIVKVKKSSYDSQGEAISDFYCFLLNNIELSYDDLEKAIESKFEFIDVRKRSISYGSTPHGRFQMHHKNNIFIRERMANELKCPICHGFMGGKFNSTDHIIRKEDGGTNDVFNGQNTHLFCNTTFKN
ncbi:GmrSD restriction endonuclease domain-containing protein [Shewanella fodinae]|uniref:GmrSD restriction endonuclease domain-containing protein n=1 Tax=Shewanella fodinae TaxID=552357 RepID=UPI00167BFBAC|nr:DUF262 domain-containing protein [Shewanella fodinae]MCL2907905.1 HNH endonuclease [Shewanella fodinae]GGZ11543.1 hypothetical protein GCM10007169_30130 [Shewanella fodinae]